MGDSAATTEARRGKACPPAIPARQDWRAGWRACPSAVAGRAWPRAGLGERIGQACVVVVLAAALAMGLVLIPSPTGTGTHVVLGLPECGMLRTTGHPCPTCGVTTSFVLAAHGRFAEAFVNQPFGLISFVLVVVGVAFASATCVAGRSWSPLLVGQNLVTLVMALLILMLVSWAYKWVVT